MSKRNKMYILVETERQNAGIQLVSSDRIKGLKVPSEDTVRTHLFLEKEKTKEDKNYRPQPLKIPMPKDEFEICMRQLCTISKPKYKEVIPMAFQWPAIPCVIIYPEKEDVKNK